MATKKLTVFMNSDDLIVHAQNGSPGKSPADWYITVKGELQVGYTTSLVGADLEAKKKFLPLVEDNSRLNYCLQKKCDSQQSILDTWALANTNEWDASVKIAAIMDQNVVHPNTLIDDDAPTMEYTSPETVKVDVGMGVGDTCPTLIHVKEVLGFVKVPWKNLNDNWTVVSEKRRLNEYRNCADDSKPKEGMKQGAGKGLLEFNIPGAPKFIQKRYDEEVASLPHRLFDYIVNGVSGGWAHTAKFLQVLNILQDIFGPDNAFEFPKDIKLCQCEKDGLSKDCWRCEYVKMVDPITNEVYYEVECKQTVKRDKHGNCPTTDGGRGANLYPSYETYDECMNMKRYGCPDKGKPDQP
tara:strand:+ start:207 stop:1268 length:1062 start_codon:yes stop_codon:yes gene_type:complete